jgi:hypothetical protein
MSQSSETTKSELLLLGYPEQMFANGYYTARVTEHYGACVAEMVGAYFIQFYPWGDFIPCTTATSDTLRSL